MWKTQILEHTGADNIDGYPVVCKGQNYNTPCTASEMAIFAKNVLAKILTPEDLKDAALVFHTDGIPDTDSASKMSADEMSATRALSLYTLRHNAITKMYGTPLSEDDIRQIAGHKIDTNAASYPITTVRNRQQLMDHRMICSDLRDDWHIEISGTGSIGLPDCGRHYVLIPAAVASAGGSIKFVVGSCEIGDNLMVEFRRALPPGVKIDLEVIHLPIASHRPSRLITDYDNHKLLWPDDISDDK